MKIAVLGGGNGGHAMAADLALAGHEVNFAELPDFADNIGFAQLRGGICLKGKTGAAKEAGFAKLNKVTTDVKEAVKGVKVIMLPVPAYGQLPFIELIAEELTDGQMIVFHPGNFGALVCHNYLRTNNINKNVILAEAECLIYACRIQGSGEIFVKAVKGEVKFSTFPANKLTEGLALINELYPQYVATENVLYTSMNNINFVLHPTSTLLNASRIELMGPYRNCYYDITPSVARIMEGIDKEKIQIFKSLGLEPTPFVKILQRYYSATGDTIYEAVHTSPTYSIQNSPPNLKYRYVTEDVPYGLVLLSAFGRALNVETRYIDTIIELASLINNEHYREIGRSLSDLGLEGMTAEEIVSYITNG